MDLSRKALNDYNRALTYCKNYPELWYAKADLLYNMGRMRESLICYRMVTKLEPANAEAWLDYGDTLLELGYYKQSLKAFEKSIEANPSSADPYYTRAKVLLVLNRTFDAIESLKQSFQLNPEKRREFEKEFPGVRSLKEFKKLLGR